MIARGAPPARSRVELRNLARMEMGGKERGKSRIVPNFENRITRTFVVTTAGTRQPRACDSCQLKNL
jgi:hypothetical protein